MKLVLKGLSFIFLLLGIISQAYAQAADCKANQFKKGDTCVACSDSLSGLSNCETCTYNNLVFKCTACSNNFYFPNTNLNNTCASCDAKCYGGTCSNADPTKSVVSKCTSCLDTYYLKDDGTCDTCKVGCKVCSSPTSCSVCSIAGQLPQRPDTGDCGVCKSPNDLGFEGVNQVCGPVPVINKIAAEINSTDNLVSLNNLCAPTVAANKDLERVGALLIFGASAETSIQLNDTLKAIREGQNEPLNEKNFTLKNRVLNTLDKIWVYVAGTSNGDGNISNIRVFKGNSVLSYVCLNAFNVESEIKTAKIINIQAINKNVQFRAKVNRTLLTEELNNLTCSLVGALKLMPVTRLRNQEGRTCNSSQQGRILQDATPGRLIFSAEASQLEDNFEANMNSQAEAVRNILVGFAANYNVTILEYPFVVIYSKTALNSKPTLNVTLANRSESSLSVAFNSGVDAVLYYGIASSSQKLAIGDLDGTLNNSIETGKLILTANSSQVKLFSGLQKQNKYNVYYFAESASALPTSTGLLNTTFETNGTQTGQSFSWTFKGENNVQYILIFIIILFLNL